MSVRAISGRSSIAFVLGVGGSLGAGQVGMMRALFEHGIGADLAVGSSVGGINVAFFAGKPTIVGLSELEAIWLRLKRSDILSLGWRGLFGILGQRAHLFSSDRFSGLLETHRLFATLKTWLTNRDQPLGKPWQRELPLPKSTRRNRAPRDRIILPARNESCPLAPVCVTCRKLTELDAYPAISEPV